MIRAISIKSFTGITAQILSNTIQPLLCVSLDDQNGSSLLLYISAELLKKGIYEYMHLFINTITAHKLTYKYM